MAVLVLSLAFVAPVAMACEPLPTPPRNAGESNEAYRERLIAPGLAELRAKSASIILVRIVSFNEASAGYRISLRPIATLSGAAVKRTFEIMSPRIQLGMCPTGPASNLALGNMGGTFVVFLSAGQPGNSTLLDAWRPDSVDAALRAQITAIRTRSP